MIGHALVDWLLVIAIVIWIGITAALTVSIVETGMHKDEPGSSVAIITLWPILMLYDAVLAIGDWAWRGIKRLASG